MPHPNGDSAPQLLEDSNSEVDAHNVTESTSRNVPIVDAPTDKDSLFYNMKHEKRGMAFIFNHENFEKTYLNKRTGSAVDRNNLEEVLKKLGFEVEVYDNLTSEELKYRIQKIANIDHTNADCVFIAVLTHGEPGRLHASDNYYTPEILWLNFTADKCTTLAGKPKLFFIQACQGDESQQDGRCKRNGLSDRTQTDGCTSNTYRIPNHADFLIAYSPVPGYLSWSNSNNECGSWFIHALTEELGVHGKRSDMLTLLTSVNRKVALNLKSDSRMIHKQIPCFNSMLTRLLIFGEK